MEKTFSKLNHTIINCRKCPRLVAWREQVAREKTRRFAEWDYWGRPVPGFGDQQARLWVIGLVPAAHGGNRTGRIFTGDQSGDWLYRALYKAGFANQPQSISRNDGMVLKDCYISALIRCAPPGNKPTPEELRNCEPYLIQELKLLHKVRIILCLGQISLRRSWQMISRQGYAAINQKPQFKHGMEFRASDTLLLVASYHPSQQNTFTGLLTEKMFDDIFRKIRMRLEKV